MSERLFDADTAPRRYSLVRLSAELARSLAVLGAIVVEGEVHRATDRYGRIYFTLRDRAAQISVVCLPRRNARYRTVDGERVAVTGKLTWVNDRGQVQLVADEVVPVGDGAVAAAIAEARARLDADGLLARPRRTLPLLPACVGVVCGAEAAVRADIESVVETRFPGYPVRFVEVGVAGAGAAERIIDAMAQLEGDPKVEVIVLARGGGDATQLLPFSDEGVCRAVAACGRVVVSAIGHHGDAPLCDEVADVRCATPSVAANLIFPSRAELDRALAGLSQQGATAMAARAGSAWAALAAHRPEAAVDAALSLARLRVRRGHELLGLIHPAPAARSARSRLHAIRWRQPVAAHLQRGRAHLASTRRQMDALSPQRVLERGYAVARTADGTVVRDVAALAPGAVLQVQLARGRATTTVEEIAT